MILLPFSQVVRLVKLSTRTKCCNVLQNNTKHVYGTCTKHGGISIKGLSEIRKLNSRHYHMLSGRNLPQSHHQRLSQRLQKQQHQQQRRTFMILRVIRAVAKVRYMLLGAAGTAGVSAKLVTSSIFS